MIEDHIEYLDEKENLHKFTMYRSSGLYASNLVRSSTHEGEACGINLAIPVPSCCGNLKSACCDLLKSQ